jgi:hypothetical protein
MTDSQATWKVTVDHDGGENSRAGHTTDGLWSFGAWHQRLLADLGVDDSGTELPIKDADNQDDDPTDVRSKDKRKPTAVPLKRFRLGLRGFKPLYQWEGVVEEVNGQGFRARLSPYGIGRNGKEPVEYADFDYLDLAEESDYDRVHKGAVFYWTIGRRRNPTGAIENSSLVRFRRIPPATRTRQLDAMRKATAILKDLGAD